MPLAAQNKSNELYLSHLLSFLPSATYAQACRAYCTVLDDPNADHWVIAELGKHDRFFLLAQILRRGDVYHPWIYERCREVEASPDGHIDLWARKHYKSTIITFAGSIQEIIHNPEITICILSHIRPISKKFLGQLKFEFETNLYLQFLYSDIFYSNPRKNSPSWSLDNGIIVKRKSNPKEATVEAWGLVDSQPTAQHYSLIIYDDTVTKDSVSTPDMILKTTESWELSRHLGSLSAPRSWYIGTRYSYADTYRTIMERRVVKRRIYPATHDGTRDGKPVLLSEEAWENEKKESSPHTLACQMLQNPIAGEEQELKEEWIRRYEVRQVTLNVAILVDPANSKKKSSSDTAFTVIGMDSASNKYFLDGASHKMNLAERWQMLKSLRKKWISQPGIQVVIVGYERYAMQSDIEHFEEMMRIENNHFPIKEVSWPLERGESTKDDRIRRLIPDHQNWRFFYPYEGNETSLMAKFRLQGKEYLLARKIMQISEGKVYNLVEKLIQNEYLFFPATTKKDILDSMSRVYDVGLLPPQLFQDQDLDPPDDEDDFE